MRTRSSRNNVGEEPTLEPRIIAECSADALQANYHAIREQLPKQSVLPMIKAEAYGHGAAWAVRQLQGLKGLYGFGVATLEEGRDAREDLGVRGRKTKVIVFSDAAPWTEEKGLYCEYYSLTPVIASDADWQAFLRGGWPERLEYELKFNTGMNRLGITPSYAPQIARSLRDKPVEWHPEGIFSHLAMAEDPSHRLSLAQRESFESLRSELSGAFPAAQFHLGNSAAIWNTKHLRLDGLTDVVRPGIALYGVPPWAGAPARGISPVMSVRACVKQIHVLKEGDCTGYGATFKGPCRVAVIGAGYADGIPRALSNGGHAWLSGHATSFAGAISMDLSALKCPQSTKVGEWAELLGPRVDSWAQAKAAGTIPYELLTSVSPRVSRVYI